MSKEKRKGKNNLPIGVFDSGVGGLTVLRGLQQVMPQESFLYLGDTARLPYGTKSPETVARYGQQASRILIDRGVKCIVIACNTASALAMPALRLELPHIPIIGVLEPGADMACKASQNKHIAVVATEATIQAQGYHNAILRICPDAKITGQSCGMFVALAEEGWTHGPIAKAVAEEYLAPMFAGKAQDRPDCLVLGCTHFPALKEIIRDVVPSDVVIVDSAIATAGAVAHALQQHGLAVTEGMEAEKTHFLVTDSKQRFQRIAHIFLNEEIASHAIELIATVNEGDGHGWTQ